MTVTIKNKYHVTIPDEFDDAILSSGLSPESSLSERMFRLFKTSYCVRNEKYTNLVDDEIVLRELANDLEHGGDYLVVKKMYIIAEAEAFRDGII